MGGTGDRVWYGWDLDQLCDVDGDTNPDLYNGKLRISETDDKAVSNLDNINRVIINRGIYSDGHIRILCII